MGGRGVIVLIWAMLQQIIIEYSAYIVCKFSFPTVWGRWLEMSSIIPDSSPQPFQGWTTPIRQPFQSHNEDQLFSQSCGLDQSTAQQLTLKLKPLLTRQKWSHWIYVYWILHKLLLTFYWGGLYRVARQTLIVQVQWASTYFSYLNLIFLVNPAVT